jgi:hypothetical protein
VQLAKCLAKQLFDGILSLHLAMVRERCAMDTIHLQEAALVREVQQVASHEGKEAEAIVEEAVRHHLAHYRQKRILAETEAWYRLPPELRNQYKEQYVAVYNGVIIDSDVDRMQLHFRVREHYARQPILIIEGGDQPMPVYRVRSTLNA